jgi:hypothetical protein
VGNIQGHDVIILIDSGSSNNFISAHLASQLVGVKKLSHPVQVKVAGGGILSGDSEIPNCAWTCQGQSLALHTTQGFNQTQRARLDWKKILVAARA